MVKKIIYMLIVVICVFLLQSCPGERGSIKERLPEGNYAGDIYGTLSDDAHPVRDENKIYSRQLTPYQGGRIGIVFPEESVTLDNIKFTISYGFILNELFTYYEINQNEINQNNFSENVFEELDCCISINNVATCNGFVDRKHSTEILNFKIDFSDYEKLKEIECIPEIYKEIDETQKDIIYKYTYNPNCVFEYTVPKEEAIAGINTKVHYPFSVLLIIGENYVKTVSIDLVEDKTKEGYYFIYGIKNDFYSEWPL